LRRNREEFPGNARGKQDKPLTVEEKHGRVRDKPLTVEEKQGRVPLKCPG